MLSQYLGLITGKSPGQLIIQLTDRCNAHCPQCAMRVSNTFKRSTLEPKRCREIIDKAAERGVRALSLTGGEPLLYPKEVARIIKHAARRNIVYTRTGTNGFIFKNPDSPDFSDRVKQTAQLLASTPLRNFWISIDSADPATHEEMRGFSGVIRGIEKAVPVFHQFGLYPTANLGLNRNLAGSENSLFRRGIASDDREQAEEYKEDIRRGLRTFFSFVENLGFTLVNFCYPMSIEAGHSQLQAVYPANSTEHLVRFNDFEKGLIFSALLETIPDYRQKIRIFTPLSALHSLKKSYSQKLEGSRQKFRPFPCRGGKDYFFINASDGHTYPCGYRGDDDLGDYRQVEPKPTQKNDCDLCDWECFRDPSELAGPILHGLSKPLSLVTRYRRDRTFYKLWRQDLRYYRACDLFDGRVDLKDYQLNRYVRNIAKRSGSALPAPAGEPLDGNLLSPGAKAS